MKTSLVGWAFAMQGNFLGQTWVLVGEDTETAKLSFLCLPKMENKIIYKNIFEHGMQIGAVEPIEQLPEDVFSVIKEQYNENINN